MPFPSRLPPCLLLAAALPLFCGCVGRGKYLESLLAQEAARSEAAAAKTDLADAAVATQRLRGELATLQDRYEAERRSAYEQQSGDLSERQALLRERTLQGLLIDSLRTERERLDSQRAGALAVIARHDERLADLRERLASRTGNFLPGQYTLSVREGAVVLSVDQRAIFDERRRPGISAAGDASLANLAGALGGQPDIRIDVAVAPRTADASAAARQEAARLASLVVSQLVEERGLLPGIVRAVALQVDQETAAVAGLVEGDRARTMEIVVTVPGDWVGEVGRVLR